jgi:hypothetical protein
MTVMANTKYNTVPVLTKKPQKTRKKAITPTVKPFAMAVSCNKIT